MRRSRARSLHRCVLRFLLVLVLVGGRDFRGFTAHAGAPTPVEAAGVYFRDSRSFLVLKRRGGHGFDWSDNGCSVPGSLRWSVPAMQFITEVFAAACAQHDFAYRNFGGALQLDPSPERRRQVDRHFFALMRARCRAADIVRHHHVVLCRFYARTFYAAVRAFGHFAAATQGGSSTARPGTQRSRGWRDGPGR